MSTTVELKNFQTRWSEISEPKPTLEPAPIHYLAPKTTTYYRSKAFVSQVGVNPLAAAASPLFFLIEKIKSLQDAPDIDKLHDDLSHEIKAFEHLAQARNYPSYVISAASFALCLWIDETVLNTAWGEHSGWQRKKLVPNNEIPHENPFFALLNRCLQNPTLYTDLLELFYLCMSFGLQGDFRQENNGQYKLTEIRDQLFDTLCQQRDQFCRQLTIDAALVTAVTQTSLLKLLLRPILTALTLATLVGSYFILDAKLAAQFSTLAMPLTSSTATIN